VRDPLTFQAIIIWRDELNEGKVFLRDIIDLEATYAGPMPSHARPRSWHRLGPVLGAVLDTVLGPDGQPIAPVPAPRRLPAPRLRPRRPRPDPVQDGARNASRTHQ